jgi:hypothetical protein
MRPVSDDRRYIARELVLKSTELSRGARLLYMALDNFQRLGSECWPGQKTLCEIVGCSSRGLCRYLDEIVKAGLCVRKRRYGQSNSFVLHWCHQWHEHGATSGTMNMPPVAQHKANQALKPEIHESPSAQSQNRPICPECSGSGYTINLKVSRGVEYEAATPCQCRLRRSA